MANLNDTIDAIEACRTCGIYYMTTSNYLKPLFQSPVEQPEMMLIRLELAQWKVEVGENDGYPQYVCSSCIHEFQKVFKFRTSCVETQEQFRHFYSIREENRANIKIKTELQDPDEDRTQCDFIYVDELSDNEYDGATPFNIPHVPIKEELIEAATIPMEDSHESSINMVESASGVVAKPSAAPTASQLNNVQNKSLTNTLSASVDVAGEMSSQEKCKLCQHLSQSQDEHKQHMKSEHEIRDLECHICGKLFKNSTPARLKFHMKWHKLSKHVKCAQCGFVCNSKEALYEHKRANHTKINCKICGKGILGKKMKLHLREHQGLSTKFPCEYCTQVFPSDNERESHIWEIHGSEDNHEVATTSNQAIVHRAPTETHIWPMNNSAEISGNPTTSHQSYVQQEAPDVEMTAEEEDELLRDDDEEEPESQEDIVSFKFFCAHCEEKFLLQIDLEMHVKQKHRPQQQITTQTTSGEDEIANANHDVLHTIAVPSNSLQEEHTAAIAVFQDYDNEDEKQAEDDNENHSNDIHEQETDKDNNDGVTNNDTTPTEHHDTHTENVTNPSESIDNQHNNKGEHIDEEHHEEHHHDHEELINTHSDVPTESQHEKSASSETSSEASEADEDEEVDAEEDKSAIYPFACAKCTKMFATIEQLRIHYEEHLNNADEEIQSPTKATFKCHICSKLFDLKFSLNRHIRKHKHAPV